MKEILEAFKQIEIDDIFEYVNCEDEFVDKIEISSSIDISFYDKADILYSEQKYKKAFKYLKIAYKLKNRFSPYLIAVYFLKGIGGKIVNYEIASNFFKEAINRGDVRGYAGLAGLTKKETFNLWEKFFNSDMIKEIEYSTIDYDSLFDYRIVFLYDIQNKLSEESSQKAKEIINLIKPSIIKDKKSLINDLENNLNETTQNLINFINAICNNNEDDFLIPMDENISKQVDNLLKKYK